MNEWMFCCHFEESFETLHWHKKAQEQLHGKWVWLSFEVGKTGLTRWTHSNSRVLKGFVCLLSKLILRELPERTNTTQRSHPAADFLLYRKALRKRKKKQGLASSKTVLWWSMSLITQSLTWTIIAFRKHYGPKHCLQNKDLKRWLSSVISKWRKTLRRYGKVNKVWVGLQIGQS